MKRRINVPLATALATTLLCTGAAFLHYSKRARIPGLVALENASVDMRFRLRGEQPPKEGDIVIVALDDALRGRDKTAFLKHAALARLIDALAALHPRAIAFDLLFDVNDVILPGEVRAHVDTAHREALAEEASRRTPALEHAAAALGEVLEATDGERRLEASLRAADNVLLPSVFFLEGVPATAAKEPPGLRGASYDETSISEAEPGQRPPRADEDIDAPLPLLAAAAAGGGFINFISDSDGRVRQVYGAIEHGGTFYPPLGLALARRGMEDGRLAFGTGQPIQLGDRELPVDPRGVLTISWLGKAGVFPTISATRILDGEVDPPRLEGKLVLVGLTDAFQDRFTTPFDTEVPGVELHATVAQNALHGSFLRQIPFSSLIPLWIVVLLGAVPSVLQLRPVRRRGAWIPGTAGLAAGVLFAILAVELFIHDHLIIPVVVPLLTCALTGGAALVAELATEDREKRQLRNAFSLYVSDKVADRILDDPDTAGLAGVRREVSILFSDIRGFSNFSENMEPEQLARFLSGYFTPMTDAVLAEDGFVDKYIGDALMAIWGAPPPQADHAARACRAALAMTGVLARLNGGWTARAENSAVKIGIGINSGVVSVGNMGSARRLNYTVVGDAVNVSARLESLTKEYRTTILASETTQDAAGGAFRFREIDRVQVKGRSGATRIFELVGDDNSSLYTRAELAAFAAALSDYRARRFEAAEKAFAALLAAHPDDGPAAVLLERSRAMRNAPPPSDWDGVFQQLSK